MDEVSYHRSCPCDGSELKPNALGPDTPPWRCDECHTSWWVAELTQEARASFNAHTNGWGHRGSETHKAVRLAVSVELETAIRRGVSLRREQLGLVHPRTLEALMKRGYSMHADFRKEIEAQLA